MIFRICLLLTLLAFTSPSIFATASLPLSGHYRSADVLYRDSLPKTRQAFLDRYGTDDTSRALIRFYFYKQKNYSRKKILFYTLAAVSIFFIILAVSYSRTQYHNGVVDEAGGEAPAVAASAVAGALTVGLTTFLQQARFRKKLMRSLNGYQQGRGVDPHISYSLLFRLCLQGDPFEQFRLFREELRKRRFGKH